MGKKKWSQEVTQNTNDLYKLATDSYLTKELQKIYTVKQNVNQHRCLSTLYKHVENKIYINGSINPLDYTEQTFMDLSTRQLQKYYMIPHNTIQMSTIDNYHQSLEYITSDPKSQGTNCHHRMQTNSGLPVGIIKDIVRKKVKSLPK